jgi:hypothetical protein
MNTESFTKAILRCRPEGQSSTGCPIKRWKKNARPWLALRPSTCQEEEEQ